MPTSDLAKDILKTLKQDGIDNAEKVIREASSLRDLRDALSELENIVPRTDSIARLISKLRARIDEQDYGAAP